MDDFLLSLHQRSLRLESSNHFQALLKVGLDGHQAEGAPQVGLPNQALSKRVEVWLVKRGSERPTMCGLRRIFCIAEPLFTPFIRNLHKSKLLQLCAATFLFGKFFKVWTNGRGMWIQESRQEALRRSTCEGQLSDFAKQVMPKS